MSDGTWVFDETATDVLVLDHEAEWFVILEPIYIALDGIEITVPNNRLYAVLFRGCLSAAALGSLLQAHVLDGKLVEAVDDDRLTAILLRD